MFVSLSSEGQVSVGGDQLAEVLHAPHVIDLPARQQLASGACWNRLGEAVNARKKREFSGGKWARYGLRSVKDGS